MVRFVLWVMPTHEARRERTNESFVSCISKPLTFLRFSGVLHGKTFSAAEIRDAMTGNSPCDDLATVVRSLPHMRIPSMLTAHTTQILRGLQWVVDQKDEHASSEETPSSEAKSISDNS